jgi:hypothetical protein
MVSAILPTLRLFYSTVNQVAFVKLVKMLKRRARDNKDGQALTQWLDWIRERAADAFDQGPGIGFGSETTQDDGITTDEKHPPNVIFEDWLNGEYMHAHAQQRERLDRFRRDGLYEFVFLSIAKALGQWYFAFADLFVSRVFAEQSLLP